MVLVDEPVEELEPHEWPPPIEPPIIPLPALIPPLILVSVLVPDVSDELLEVVVVFVHSTLVSNCSPRLVVVPDVLPDCAITCGCSDISITPNSLSASCTFKIVPTVSKAIPANTTILFFFIVSRFYN